MIPPDAFSDQGRVVLSQGISKYLPQALYVDNIIRALRNAPDEYPIPVGTTEKTMTRLIRHFMLPRCYSAFEFVVKRLMV